MREHDSQVLILATRTCHHRPHLEAELKKHGIPFTTVYTDERPDLLERFSIRHSPVLLVDEQPIFIGMPSLGELEAWIATYRSGSFKDG